MSWATYAGLLEVCLRRGIYVDIKISRKCHSAPFLKVLDVRQLPGSRLQQRRASLSLVLPALPSVESLCGVPLLHPLMLD